MSFAQGLFERIMQLFRAQLLSLLQVHLHELLVDLDHLVDQLRVGLRDRREVRGLPQREEEVDDALRAVDRQIERQAFGAELRTDLLERRFRSTFSGSM